MVTVACGTDVPNVVDDEDYFDSDEALRRNVFDSEYDLASWWVWVGQI